MLAALHTTTGAWGASSWEGPPICPAPADWVSTTGSDARVGDVQVAISRRDEDWTALIVATYEGSVGTRELAAGSCAEITQAVLVALSLLNGKDPPAPVATDAPAEEPAPTASFPPLSERTAPTLPAATTARPPPATHEPTPTVAPTPEPVARRPDTSDGHSDEPELGPLLFSLGGAFVVASEGNRTATLGGALAIGAWLEPLALRLEAGVRAPPSDLSGPGDVRIDFTLFSLRADACAFSDRWGPIVSLCAGPIAGYLAAQASGISHPVGDEVWLGGGSGSVGVRSGPRFWKIGGWLEARGEGRADAPRFRVEPYGSVFEFPRWSGVVGAGLEAWL